VELIMQRAFGLEIPQMLEDICDPTQLALIVYDMQIGIVKQIENGQQIAERVLQVLDAARKARIRVFFTRHMSLLKELMGVSQFRMAMAWQRGEIHRRSQALVLARRAGIPADSRDESSAERSHSRQDHHVGV
jgi:nicotinamidase-related amidase